MITKNKKGFDGRYDPVGANGLSKLNLIEKGTDGVQYFDASYRRAAFIKPLDDLLKNSTADVPSERPTIQYFYETLSWWIATNKDLETRNPIEWQEIQSQLFPSAMPQRVIWENPKDIAYILNLIGSIAALNHMFYPSGGGMDLEGAKLGLEPNTIELIVDLRSVELIKPQRLIFENFNSDTQWNYFRLETDFLEPTGIGGVYRGSEELVEIEPLHYIDRVYWDEGRYDGEELPSTARLVNRFMEGNFVLFAKKSFYNHAPSTYDGRHNKMTTDEFREYIAQKVKLAEELLANEKDMSMTDLLKIHFRNDFNRDHQTRFRDKSYDENVSDLEG